MRERPKAASRPAARHSAMTRAEVLLRLPPPARRDLPPGLVNAIAMVTGQNGGGGGKRILVRPSTRGSLAGQAVSQKVMSMMSERGLGWLAGGWGRRGGVGGAGAEEGE